MANNIKFINESLYNSNNYIQKETVDLFFCDPPYFLSGRQNTSADLEFGNINDWDNQWKNEQEFYNWTEEWLTLAYNQLKNTGSIYVCIWWKHSGKFQELMEKVGFIIHNRITWKRDKGRGSNTNWKSMHEDIWFATKSNDYTFNIDDVKIKKDVVAPYRDQNGNPK